MSLSDDGDSAQALSSIQSPGRIGLIRSHPRSGFNLSLGSVVDDVSSVREDPPAEHGEEGEVDEGPDDDGSFVFAPKKLNFQQDFRYFAIPAAEYCGFEVPPPVQLPNAALPSGDVFAVDEMDSAVELRYPEARSHVEAFLRPFTKTVSHSLSTSLVKAREATLVPFFKTLSELWLPTWSALRPFVGPPGSSWSALGAPRGVWVSPRGLSHAGCVRSSLSPLARLVRVM